MSLTSNHLCLTDSNTYVTCKLTIVCVVDERMVSNGCVKVRHEGSDVLGGRKPLVEKVTHVEEACIQQQRNKLELLKCPAYNYLQL